MKIVTLPAEKRDTLGSANARRLRRAGRLPVNLYGMGRPTVNFSLDAHAFALGFARGNRMFELEVGDQTQVCLLKDVQYDALGDHSGGVDLLYIDGAHRWGPAARDIRQWGARHEPGSVMLIHDSFSSIGVTAAQITELFFGARFRYEGRSQSMTQYRRADLGPADRVLGTGERHHGQGGSLHGERRQVLRLQRVHVRLAAGPRQGLGFQGHAIQVIGETTTSLLGIELF